jgi:hypothetical protein
MATSNAPSSSGVGRVVSARVWRPGAWRGAVVLAAPPPWCAPVPVALAVPPPPHHDAPEPVPFAEPPQHDRLH